MSARDMFCEAKMVPNIIPPTFGITSLKVWFSTVSQFIQNIFQRTTAIHDSFRNSFEDTSGIFTVNEYVFNFPQPGNHQNQPDKSTYQTVFGISHFST